MVFEDCDRIERELGVKLPDYYREAAENGRLKNLLNADPGSVIAINRAFRAGDFGDENWPAHIYAFADDGGGNFYCINLQSSDRRVLCRDHETLELVAEAADFAAWLEGK